MDRIGLLLGQNDSASFGLVALGWDPLFVLPVPGQVLVGICGLDFRLLVSDRV